MNRLWRKQRKLEAKLGNNFRKPKGMHLRTFDRIFTQLNDVLGRQNALFIAGSRAP